jgi:hypothetical protein
LATSLLIQSYEQAVDTIRRFGILPLSSCIPEHPSLESITAREAWHTGLDTDPWLWRDRFAAEGVAAYGRFFKKKPILVSAELFPLLHAALNDGQTPEERYEEGGMSIAAKKIHAAVEERGGIDTKSLRAEVGMKDKESKSDYDKALIELQESVDLVIAGISDRLNENGQKSGWNSTCYELADRWMRQHGQQPSSLHSRDAKQQLLAHLEPVCTEKAYAWFKKLFA